MQRSQRPKEMMEALVADSKNPQELAERLQMLDARQQTQVMKEIQRANPQLFIKVMQAIKKMNEESTGNGNVVDMRPMPEQKPPRRTEKPV